MPSVVVNVLAVVGRRLSVVVKARVAELADALDLGSSGETLAGSIPASRTTGFLFC